MKKYIISIVALLGIFINTLSAQTAAAPKVDAGDTAWMIVATAFVLLMSIPGLALFYGGLVRRKNVLNVFSLIYEFFTFLFHDKNITFRAFGI